MDASNPVNKQSNKTDREIKDWTEYAKKRPSTSVADYGKKAAEPQNTFIDTKSCLRVATRRDAAASHRMNLNEFRFVEYARIAKWVLPSGCKVKKWHLNPRQIGGQRSFLCFSCSLLVSFVDSFSFLEGPGTGVDCRLPSAVADRSHRTPVKTTKNNNKNKS